jgi:hypothetical protein
MSRRVLLPIVLLCSVWTAFSASSAQRGAAPALPRTADGKPNLQGVWQVKNKAAADLLGERGVVEGGAIPYRPEAAAKRRENFSKRATEDPLNSCFMPGVPRIMYLDYPYHIFQTKDHVAITFEWSQVYRLIYTNGSKGPVGIEAWMGDSRGRWEGDTLVVDVKSHNDRTWFDAAGNHHSDALSLVERYTMQDADTIQYEVTVTDPKVFTRPWKLRMPIVRQKDKNRILEFQCQAEKEEASGAFERDPRTWYPGR